MKRYFRVMSIKIFVNTRTCHIMCLTTDAGEKPDVLIRSAQRADCPSATRIQIHFVFRFLGSTWLASKTGFLIAKHTIIWGKKKKDVNFYFKIYFNADKIFASLHYKSFKYKAYRYNDKTNFFFSKRTCLFVFMQRKINLADNKC